MRLHLESSSQRVYQSEVDPTAFHYVRRETRGFYRLIERATYESHDPADKARVETVYTVLRRELAVWGAEHDELEFVGGPERAVSIKFPDVEPEPGLHVASIALILQQTYWPPAPTEEEA